MAAPHTATVVWTRGTDDFLDQRYHRSHQWQFDEGELHLLSERPGMHRQILKKYMDIDDDMHLIEAVKKCAPLYPREVPKRRRV